MIKVDSVVKINFAQLNALKAAQSTALEQTAEALHTEVVQAQVIPRDTGNLQGESFFCDYRWSKIGKVSLIHSTPYARRLYFHPEYHFHKEPWEETRTDKNGQVKHIKHDGNPNAKGKWFEDWISGGKYEDFAQKTYTRLYRRLAGL